MEKLQKGFYTALGTPLDEKGNLVKESLIKEIDMQIEAGASGLLLMGSMGIEAGIKTSEYAGIVKVAVEAVKGRVPLFVGAMDNSIARVKERIEAIKDYDFTAVVLTTPFYSTTCEAHLVNFFERIADASPKPIFLYDLAVVTKQKITYPMVQQLAKHPNIKGIKSGDVVLARQIKNNIPDFEVLYSNIDAFDVAMSYGIDKVLDGMFSCTPVNARKFITSALRGDVATAGKYLDNILKLRDTFIIHGVMYSFTQSMNLLGMEGIFNHDYDSVPDGGAAKAHVESVMKEIEECD